jgi:hypothetical protein
VPPLQDEAGRKHVQDLRNAPQSKVARKMRKREQLQKACVAKLT